MPKAEKLKAARPVEKRVVIKRNRKGLFMASILKNVAAHDN